MTTSTTHYSLIEKTVVLPSYLTSLIKNASQHWQNFFSNYFDPRIPLTPEITFSERLATRRKAREQRLAERADQDDSAWF